VIFFEVAAGRQTRYATHADAVLVTAQL